MEPADAEHTFPLYVTYVDGEGPFLKISGQLDKHSSLRVESQLEAAREKLEKNIGVVPPGAIHEGVICAAKYKDGAYYRAKIINITKLATGLVGVHFIDFGNKDIVSVSTIRFLDNYDPILQQLRGQATDYYLSRVMQPSGRWDEPLLLKLQNLLCNWEYPATVEAQMQTCPVISIQFKGNDISTSLVSNGIGISLPVHRQKVLLLQMTNHQQSIPSPTLLPHGPLGFTEHAPLMNQSFPNLASALPLNQNVPLSYSLQSLRTMTNFRAPERQPQHAPPIAAPLPLTRPTTSPVKEPVSPKKSIRYKKRLLEVNSQHKVFVFAEDGPELFAVQLVNDAKKLQDMMDDINRRPHHSLAEPPMIGTVCLGRMKDDKIIYRAIVMDLSGSNCKLFSVDFGFTEVVSYYDVFVIPEEFAKPNIFAMDFCLSGVKKLEKSAHLNETFKQLVSANILTLRVVSPEGPPLVQYGELFLENKNVFDLLMAKLQFKWMEMLPLGCRQAVFVSYVESCIKFYVQLSDKIDELNAVMDAVKAHCENSSSPGALPVGAVCCARYPEDDNWYRAIVRDTNGSKIVVAYVDYGNQQDVRVEDLRTITPDLIKLPAQAMKCALKGFENRPVETKTSKQLEMIALEKTLMAHVVGMLSNDAMIVTLVDDTDNPPLDIARKMNQLSQPRSVEPKATTPIWKEAPETISSPEGSVPDDSRQKSFRREKSFKEEWWPRAGQRGGSFRGRPRENHAAVSPGADDEWEASPAPAAVPPREPRPSRDHTSDRDNRCGQQNDDNQSNDRGRNVRQEQENLFRPDNRGERRDWGDKREGWNQKREFRDNRFERGDKNDTNDRGDRNSRGDRSNSGDRHDRKERGDRGNRSHSSPKDRADELYRPQYSDTDKRSSEARPRGEFTRVQRKELADPLPLETPFTEPTVEMGSQQEVSISWFISPVNFYMQILSLHRKFLEMMHKIPELYKGVKPFTGNVPVGASVLARYPADGVLYRATVLSVQPFSKFIVRYVDYGNKQLVDAKDIWQMDRELMELPKVAVHCSLTGVGPKEGQWKAGPEIDLGFNAPRYQCIFQDCVEDQYKVSLWNNGMSVADMLVAKQLAIMPESQSSVAPAIMSESQSSVVPAIMSESQSSVVPAIMSESQSSVALNDESLNLAIIVGQQILCRVTHVESFDKFYVQLDLDKANLVESSIANFDVAKLTPLMDINCMVKHDGKIYRAKLNDSDSAYVQVVLPDFGNVIATSIDNVMIFPPELGDYFDQSLVCRLNNYTPESRPLLTIEELKSKLTGKKVIIYVNGVDEFTVVATLYDPVTGQKIAIFEPDDGANDEVVQLCKRAVFSSYFGNARLTRVKDLNELYLQKAADGDRIALLLEELYKYYEEGAPEPIESVKVDALCAAKSADGNWYRATVISSEEEQVKVQFSDYGYSETVAIDAIKKLDPKFFEPCTLALVVSLGLTALQEDAITKLIEWTTEKEVLVTLGFGSDGWLANLDLEGVDLSAKLVYEKLAAPHVTTNYVTVTPEGDAPEEAPVEERYSQVYITHIDRPGQFWVQMLDKAKKIDEIQTQLQTSAASYTDLDTREKGTLCVAKYSVNDQWYRAEILDSNSDLITIRLIDYGYTDVLGNQPGLIKVIPDHLKDIERYAIKAGLSPTETGEWPEPASDYFTQLVGDLSAPVLAFVVIKDVTTYEDIFVNVGQEVHSSGKICYINSLEEFYMQLDDSAANLDKVTQRLCNADGFEAIGELKVGSICAAFCSEDETWYRGKILEFCDVGYHVQFIDYGNKAKCEDLKQLPEDIAEIEPMAKCCRLSEFAGDANESAKSKLEDLKAEQTFQIEFLDSLQEPSLVRLLLNGTDISCILKSDSPVPNTENEGIVEQKSQVDKSIVDLKEQINASEVHDKEQVEEMVFKEITDEFHNAEKYIGDANDLESSNQDLSISVGSSNTVIQKSFEENNVSMSNATSEEIATSFDDKKISTPDKEVSAKELLAPLEESKTSSPKKEKVD